MSKFIQLAENVIVCILKKIKKDYKIYMTDIKTHRWTKLIFIKKIYVKI